MIRCKSPADGGHVFTLEPSGVDSTRVRQSEEFRGLLVHVLPRSVFERAHAASQR
jgi:hypothetical protein